MGYVIEHDAGTFFHAGDSRPAEAFSDVGEQFDIDVGALTNGTVGSQYIKKEDRGRGREE